MQERRSTGLFIAGFAVVAILIIAGLFLIFRSDGAAGEVADAPADAAVPAADTEANAATEPAPAATEATGTSLAAVDAPAAAPDSASIVGSVYNVTYGANSEPAALDLPDNADINNIDIYSWDGSEWLFVPSRAAGAQLVANAGLQPQTVALAAPADAAGSYAIGTLLSPQQELPVETLPQLTEVAAGTLVLAADGSLSGEVAEVASGPYQQLLHVTNSGVIADVEALNALLADADTQTAHVADLLARAGEDGFAGVLLDYQGAAGAQRDAYTGFVVALADALHGAGLQLGVVLAAPTGTADNWDSAGQDWAALAQVADAVYLRLPLNPAAYADNGEVDQMLQHAVRQIDRRKLTTLVSASAVDGIGESFMAMSNDEALANFGELQFVSGGEEVEPETAVEVALSGTAEPLEWDGASLTYRYAYQVNGQTHNVWLGHEAALAHRMRFASRYRLRGVMVDGLNEVSNGTGYAAALSSLQGTADAPQPTDAAIVWTVLDTEENVLASDTGGNLTFAWDGSEADGAFTINADFAMGDTISQLGSVPVTVAAADEELVQIQVEADGETEGEADAEETAAEEETTTPVVTPGDADAVVNVGANVRLGPGLGYGTIAGGLTAGSRIALLGRSDDSSWFNILMPDGETEGWIFASLVTVSDSINISDLAVVEAPPLVVSNPGGGDDSGGGGTAPAPPPVSVAPITNSGFELGGQAFGAPYGMMSYAGMTWVKKQYKWSSGSNPTDVAGMIAEAHNAGFKILISIPGVPYPSELPDFGAYVEFMRGVASLPDPPDALEVWNEQNIDAEWPAGQISPSSYVNNMLAPVYNAIKGANSNIMVISGAPAPTGFFGGGCGAGGCDDAVYVAQMAAAGAASYMDCIGIHYNEGILSPNQTSGDPRSEHYTRYFWGMLNAYWNAFGGSRPLCFTELGYLSGEGYGELPANFAWAGNVTVAQQAQWLAEAASLSANSGKVRMMIVWNIDSSTWGTDPQAGFAIIRPGGGCAACETLRQVTGGR